MGGALWGYCLGPSTGKKCCHCYFQYKYSPMSSMGQFSSVYCFSWINDIFGLLFHDSQALCTGRDQAAIQIHYPWPYLKTIRSSNLLCLFSWVNFLCVRPIIKIPYHISHITPCSHQLLRKLKKVSQSKFIAKCLLKDSFINWTTSFYSAAQTRSVASFLPVDEQNQRKPPACLFRNAFYSFSLSFHHHLFLRVSTSKTDPNRALIWKAYLLSISKSQFSTHYVGILYIPWVVTHCSPLSVVPNFHTTLIMVGAIYKTNGGLSSVYRV